jgi:hypothetical protein
MFQQLQHKPTPVPSAYGGATGQAKFFENKKALWELGWHWKIVTFNFLMALSVSVRKRQEWISF